MQEIKSPYPQFFDSLGAPLNGGQVYIGVASQNPMTSPTPVFWDFEATQPAAQPLRVQNGVICRAGTPAKIYTSSENYSIAVKDQKGQLLYSQKKSDSDPSLRSDLAASSGSSLLGWIQSGTGSVVRTVQEKLREWVSLRDVNAAGDGYTDDLAAVNQAINNTFDKEPILTKGLTYFLSAKPTNPLGKKFWQGGRLLMNAPQGGQVQINTYGDGDDKVILGKEYMYRIWKRLEVNNSQLTGFIYGDSTVATAANGGGYAGATFEPQNLLKLMLARKGMILPAAFINRAIGGSSVYQMNAMPDLLPDGSTDVFIIKYGINDAGRGLSQFAIDLRTKLAEIRANGFGTVNNLTIVLMMPSATYDPQHGRASPWYEQLRGVYVQAARDYKCVLFDTYAYLRDVDWAATYMMDNPFSNGQGVHPTSIMQNMIWAGLVDHLFTPSEMLMYAQVQEVPLTLITVTNYGTPFKNATVSMGLDGYVAMSGLVNLNGMTAPNAIAQPPFPYFAAAANNDDLFYCVNNTNTPAIVRHNSTNSNLELFYVPAGCLWISLNGVRYKARNRP